MKRFIRIFFISLIFMTIHYIPSLAESSNPNAPVLLQGMIPVKWENGYEYETTSDDLDWYNYDSKKWANAKDEDGNYWVWIPRYMYKIDGDRVLLKWSIGITDDKEAIADGYMVHPAFVSEAYIGGDPNDASSYKNRTDDNQLTGFWVAKYLASEKDGSAFIGPNRQPDVNKNIGEAFDACLNMSNELGTSSHLIKASEWGAVAYLSNVFGIMPVENSTGLTGTEVSYSTTNNRYGVFDINGPVGEYLSAFVIKDTINSSVLSYSGKMIDDEYDRFVDVVGLIQDDNSSNNEARLSDFYGFAMSETKNFNLYDLEEVPTSASPFFSKGGSNVGLYGYGKSNGTGLGFRPTLSIYTSYLAEDLSFFDTEASIVAGDYLVLSVNFSVDENWKFDLDPGEEIIKSGKVVSGKEKRIFDFIDLRYVQNNKVMTFSNANLNEHLIGIVEGDRTITDLTDATEFNANTQYTVRVRVGGYNDTNETEPVFLAIPGMTSRIIVEGISVKSVSNGADLKITKIPNNKVRLSIYDTQGRVPVLTGVKLLSSPEKVDYYYGEKLSLVGGKLEVSYGDNKAIVDLTKDNVVDYNNVTYNVGENQLVDLVYSGMNVSQDEVQFRINVSGNEKFSVSGRSSPPNTAVIVSGIGNYEKGESVRLKASVYPGYKFSSWSSSDVSIADVNSVETSFTMPEKDVSVTVNTIGAMRLEVIDVKTEFELNEAFGLGSGKIVAYYPDATSETLTLSSNGVTSNPTNNQILDTLGTKEVTIKYGGKEISYEISIVKTKYNLTFTIDSLEYGSIKKDGEVVVPINDAVTSTVKVSYDTTVSIEAVPNEGYDFYGWYVTESDVILNDSLGSESVSFIMPQKSFIIKANFVKSHKVKYLVNDSNYGSISGEAEQIVKHGENATEVIAVPNTGYKFKKWSDNSTNASRLDQYITNDVTYTASFVKTWTVQYLVDGVTFMTRTVEHGESGYISEVPKKYGYVFDSWDVDLEYVTNDIVTNAVFLPRISISPNGSIEPSDFVEGHITGRSISVGTLEYIISESSTDTGENISDYISNETFNFEGSWEIDSENPELYRSYVRLASKEDSSTTITIYSNNDKEIVKFDYMLSVTSGQLLGITINGNRITEYDEELDVWHSFNGEVNTVNGKIVVGISYSQDSVYADTDFAAIRNLKTGRHWTKIDNEYDLKDSAIWSENYVHIRGVGSDDGVTYQIVSDLFKGNNENMGDLFTISYELNGGTVTGNPTSYTSESETITLINPTKVGSSFIGWTGSNGTTPELTITIPKGSNGNRSYTANWSSNGYVITVTQSEGGVISPDTVSVTGGNKAFTITPNSGYKISDVIVDGSSIGAKTTYTFISVAEDHTITAMFESSITSFESTDTLVEGKKYVLYSYGYAMTNESGNVSKTAVSPENGVISTDDSKIIWTYSSGKLSNDATGTVLYLKLDTTSSPSLVLTSSDGTNAEYSTQGLSLDTGLVRYNKVLNYFLATGGALASYEYKINLYGQI